MVFRFAPHSGGAVIVATEIANNLAKLGHKVTVLTPDFPQSGHRYQPALNSLVKVIRVDTPSKSNLKVAARRCKPNLEKMGKLLGKNEKFDFVLTIFHPFHLVPNAAISCAKSLRIPSIIKIDDAIYEKSSGLKTIQRKIEKIISTRSLRNASRVLVSNEPTKEIMKSYYSVEEEKISIVPNGVDLSFFRPAKKDPKKLVFSGVMYHHRGLDILLESAPAVIKQVPDVRLVLLGDGPEMNELQNIVKKNNLESNIEIKGWVERQSIPTYLSDASIGIGPLKRTTVTENALPIKVLEYMASGLPIIAKTGTLPNDVLINNENGYFVENSSDLSKNIIKLLQNPELAEKMGKISFDMVQKFSWEKIVKSIIKIYEQV
ncbi:MAG TPA: glycosyltransferase family 4 protein [Nitrosopumilaceae archaeon]|nr:glycosyltransferase family 4 protein [Nitrosopumilaceae archaeon]